MEKKHKIAVVVPVDLDTFKNYDVFQELEHDLREAYGGFSRYSGHGEWLDGEGNTHAERHVRYEACTDITDTEIALIEAECIASFVEHNTTEEAVHWEVEPVYHGNYSQ